jgi:hypothetical protein
MCIKVARLFYNDLNASLEMKMNFVRNMYDPFVYNKETDEGTITIQTHVDELKISAKLENGRLLMN